MRVVVIEAEQGASGSLASRLTESGFTSSLVVPDREALRNDSVNRASPSFSTLAFPVAAVPKRRGVFARAGNSSR